MKYMIKETAVEAMQWRGKLDMLQLHWLRTGDEGYDFRGSGTQLQIFSPDSVKVPYPSSVVGPGDYIVRGMGIVYAVPAKVFETYYVKQD